MRRIEKINLYDCKGYCEGYDFSQSNMSVESRVAVITTIASVCYGKDEAKNPQALYDRLLKEAGGLPSSSFEFIPILYSLEEFAGDYRQNGIVIENKWYLTNLREALNIQPYHIPFNTTEEEQGIIRKFFKVFKQKTPKFIAVQDMRHRKASYQELSRRYTKEAVVPFDFYNPFGTLTDDGKTVDDFYNQAVNMYNLLVSKGYSAEKARAVIPFGFFTTYWSAYLLPGFNNMIKLRTDSHTQKEFQELAFARLQITNNQVRGE